MCRVVNQKRKKVMNEGTAGESETEELIPE